MITIEGNNIEIISMDENGIELVDGDALFKSKVFDATTDYDRCSHPKYTIKLYNYTVEPVPDGYLVKQTIREALEKMTKEISICQDMDKAVDHIYDRLKIKRLLK